ncbi:MAG: glycosyltransferase family 1 protein [Anaerolineaceae bacterium]|nr:glycosyltransferase family 1 protein [Anaerolineaceae bacterium]
MRPSHTFRVVPCLPPRLERLRELAHNLWWTWNHEAIELFQRLEPDLWQSTGHNPVLMLGTIRQERLEQIVDDDGFMAHLDRVYGEFDRYMKSAATWYAKTHASAEGACIGYFSAEFGLTESLGIYAGGLGILAGDHLKSASDLGLPLVGMGLLYQQGYFHQYLNPDGWQQELYPDNDFYNLPLNLERQLSGAPLTVEVEYPGRTVKAQVWRAQVGRVPLYLLDTNVEANRPEDRDLTDQLYGGDDDMRIRQEMMLGIGGIRALSALGIEPNVCHMNEGHSAFLALERIRVLMEECHLSFQEAREVAMAGHVFTTHTPVPAGIDWFHPELVDRYFGHYYPRLGLSRDEFLGLGRLNPNDPNGYFCMAVLALRLANRSNGVSQLHAQVSREMWQEIWPGVPVAEVPILGITNGIHPRSWISRDMADLFSRYLGPRWVERPAEQEIWQRVARIPDEELWRTHERRRERLVAFARRRLAHQLQQRGTHPSEIQQAEQVLDPEALTIGFARRFATYKRGSLLFHDLERLARIVGDKDRPVQIIFAGKAHPRDNPGKELIRQIVHHARRPEFRNRIVFLEDYDMVVGRYLVQGVDVWLNTPRRPHEASGTSGMKATANGALNLSVLDGWWDEGYTPETGWAIGHGEDYEQDQAEYQDRVEADALYNLLEKEIVPLFYERGSDGLPRGWIARMKAAMRNHAGVFNTNRMVRDYTELCYLPSAQRSQRMMGQDMQHAKTLASWKEHVRKEWGNVRIERTWTEQAGSQELRVGDQLQVLAEVYLGALKPTDVAVQLYYGPVDGEGIIVNGRTIPTLIAQSRGKGRFVFAGAITCQTSGRHGYALRIVPAHEDLGTAFEMGLVLWAA